jgi:uncharacterized protein YgiM (DUF1202 family)
VLLVSGVLVSAAMYKPKSTPAAESGTSQTSTEEEPVTPEAASVETQPAPAPQSPETAEAPSCPSAVAMYVNTPRSLNLRAERSLNARVITKMPYGAAVRAGCRSGDWLTVTYNFKTGYALAQYLSTTPPNTGGSSHSSFKVTEVAATVSPTGTQLDCEREYTFTGTIKTDGAGTVNYAWERSDGSTVRGSVNFTAAGTKTVIDRWKVTTSMNGWAHLRITSPNVMVSNDAQINFVDTGVCI